LPKQIQSVEKFVKSQVEKWKTAPGMADRAAMEYFPVVTVCMEAGSGGCFIAKALADKLDYDFFHRDIVQGIAQSVKISDIVVETLERERLTGVMDFISSVVKEKYLYPGLYLQHLMKVVGTIGQHGRAVIVGRGANFILPADSRFSIRVVAPMEVRIRNISRLHRTPPEEARRRIIRRDAKRRAFVRESFYTDISDPTHYDLILNTARLAPEAAVGGILEAMRAAKAGLRKR